MKHHPLIPLPSIGFGTAEAHGAESEYAVNHALDTGYRLIDTADIYGNEEAVGRAIARSGLAREEIIVTSKLHINKKGYDSTRVAFQQSLKKLQLDYLDIYLIHWPANATHNPHDWQQINADSWRAMEELQQEGLIRGIGLSNFMPEHLDALYQTATVCPLLNQIEFHPGHMQEATRAACAKKGILIEAWSPLGIGTLLQHPLILEMAAKYGRSTAQICLRWCMQHDALPIPKSVNLHRIEENFKVMDFCIEESDMQRIDGIPACGYTGWDPYSMKA